MNSIVWGIPSQVVRKTERFDNPTLSMSAITKVGAGRKLSFNKAAKDALGLVGGESFVTFGFDGTDVFVKCVGTFEKDDKGAFLDVPPNVFGVTGVLSVLDKKTFEYIAKIKGLSTIVENHLALEQVEGQPFMKVTTIITDDNASNTVTAQVENTVSVETDAFDEATLAEADLQSELSIETPKAEAPKKVKKAVEVKTPEVVSEPAPDRVKFAIDETEEDQIIEQATIAHAIHEIENEEVEEEDEW